MRGFPGVYQGFRVEKYPLAVYIKVDICAKNKTRNRKLGSPMDLYEVAARHHVKAIVDLLNQHGPTDKIVLTAYSRVVCRNAVSERAEGGAHA